MAPEIERTPPAYRQIANTLRDRILSGDLRPGEGLPSEREIAEEWGVSRPTVTKALNVLRSEGVLVSRVGAGTFVAQRPRSARLARHRYGPTRADQPLFDDDETQVVTHAEITAAPPEITAALGLEDGKAIRRRRVISDPSGPTEVSTSWWSAEIAEAAPDLLKLDVISLTFGGLQYVEQATGRRRGTVEEAIFARGASQDEAEALGQEAGSPVLVIEQVILDTTGAPLEVLTAALRSDQRLYEEVRIA